MAKPTRVLSDIRQAETRNTHDLAKLDGTLRAQQRQIEFLTGQLAETNLKLLYAMQMVEVKRTTGRSDIILAGDQPQTEAGTLFEFYRRDRPAFVAQIEREYAANRQEIARQAEIDQIEREQAHGIGDDPDAEARADAQP